MMDLLDEEVRIDWMLLPAIVFAVLCYIVHSLFQWLIIVSPNKNNQPKGTGYEQ